MLVLPGSEVDHVPTVSGSMGQLPLALPVVENCTRLAGDDEWSPIALAGVMLAVMMQLLLEVPPHPVERTLREIIAENNTEVFMRTHCLTQRILYCSNGCRGPGFLSRSSPVENQTGPDKSRCAPNQFGFKEDFVLSARGNRCQKHGACCNKECKRSGNPDAWHAAGNQHCLASGVAVLAMRQLDGGCIHIKERNEIENH